MKRKFIKLIIVIVLMVVVSRISLIFLSNRIMPLYMSYCEIELKRVITTVINKSITEDITNSFNVSDLFIIKNLSSNVTVVDFDPVILNRAMSSIADSVYVNLYLLSEKNREVLEKYNLSESIFYIPTGTVFNTPLLNNLGPRIPVKLELNGFVNPNIKTSVKEYGINNSLVEVFIEVVSNVKMILPMYSKEIEVVVVVPLAVKLIQGNVPEYYLGNFYDKKIS